MKKIYIAPQIRTVELNMESTLLVTSIPIGEGSGDQQLSNKKNSSSIWDNSLLDGKDE